MYIHLQDRVLEWYSGRVLFNFHSFLRHNHSPREYTFDKWRAQAEVRFSSNYFSNWQSWSSGKLYAHTEVFHRRRVFQINICCRRRSSLAFRRKQSDEEVEELARVERLKRLGKGKDTVFKIRDGHAVADPCGSCGWSAYADMRIAMRM